MSTLESVRSFPTPEPTPTITLDFSPHHEAYIYTLGEVTVSPPNTFYAHINENVTFTATIKFSVESRWAVGYKWIFGDGVVAYSNPAIHLFTQPNTASQVSFILTDNQGVEWVSRKAMYLK